jgi:hypothetical protein
MTDEEIIELMLEVRDGKLTVNEAVDQLLGLNQ